jgi:hypothetical protein
VDLKVWLTSIFVGFGLGCLGLIIWAVVSGNTDCPKGQQAGIVTYMPVAAGGVTTVQPVYGCVPND